MSDNATAGSKRKRRTNKFRGVRAHANPLADKDFNAPDHPDLMDWSQVFPAYFTGPGNYSQIHPDKRVEFADVGCGFGGLTVALAEAFPDTLTVGLELRGKVVEHVQDRFSQLKITSPSYNHIGVLHANAMMHLTQYFHKAQLQKMFFLFADPHFKRANHRRRIVQPSLASVYAYVMQPKGRLYTITDVKDLHESQVAVLDHHKCFRRMTEAELKDDECVALLYKTEEAAKVKRNGGTTHLAIYERQ